MSSPNNFAPIARTNGDLTAAAVGAARGQLAELGRWAAANPDEVIAGAAPVLILAAATRRHHLTWPEAFLIAEVGYWCGVLALREYRRWKARPAGPAARLSVVKGK